MRNNDNYAIDIINVLSLIIGLENINLNDKQIKDLQEHLNKQDKQYERIIELLEKNSLERRELSGRE